MKFQKAIILAVTFLAAVPGAWADDAHHPDQDQKPAAAAAPAKPTEPPVQQMKENADKLRAQVDKIAKTRDPAERQKLMQEHMQTLRAGMTMAGGGMGGGPGAGGMGMMMDCPMMGQMKGGDMMMQRMQQMEKRMDMMQMMMEQTRKPATPAR
jgi:hypothetical protein